MTRTFPVPPDKDPRPMPQTDISATGRPTHTAFKFGLECVCPRLYLELE